MTNTYNTLNPLGSTSAKDLSDNASNFDEGMNSLSPSFYDRFKRRRETWAGMEKMVADFLEAMGFEATHLVYVDGSPLTVLRPTQLVERAPSIYKVKQPASFPVSLTGNWATDQLLLVDVGDAALRQSLTDSLSPTNGAALIGRAVQTVDSVASLRLLSKTSAAKTAFATGHTASMPGRGGGIYLLDILDTTSADNNGNIIVAADGGRWKMPFSGTITPQMFGAAGDGTVDDWTPVQEAINYLRSVGGGHLDSGASGTTFSVSKPIRLYSNMKIKGNGYFIARTGFTTTVVFPTYSTLVPQTYNALMYFNDGAFADDPTNYGYRGLEIDSTVEIYGNYNCENGIILEGITNYRIDARIQRFNSIGLYAKYYCWGGTIRAHISSCRTALLKLGEASNGIDLNGLKAYGDADTPTYGIHIVGDNNGINLSGAFVEKMVDGIYWDGLSGPGNISGVDFEDCTTNLITVDGTGLVGRTAGPVTISGSFLEAGSLAIRAINAVVIVEGCRIRDTPIAFLTTGPMARIYERGNQLENVTTRASGMVISDIANSASRRQINRLPNALSSYVESYGVENNSYSYNEELMVNGLRFSSSVVDIPTQKMLSTSTWETRELRNGSVYGVLGVVLDYSTGARNFRPLETGTHYCGVAAFSWAGGSTQVAFTVTSDARKKQQIKSLSQSELSVAVKLKGLLRSFKLNSQVDEFGDKAKIHVGVIAQDVIAAFKTEGLNALDYEIVNYSEWEGSPEVRSEDGSLMSASVESGNLYSVNYEQLLAFIISAM
jgi:hypothetical protein